jgi:hypothetical protein
MGDVRDQRAESLTGIAVEASELEEAAERFEEQIDRAVGANPEIQDLVRRLEEEQAESIELEEDLDVPTGDSIASDFQRFLRQRSDPDQRG